MATELDLRKDLIAACLNMNALGINQGTSGNISLQYEDRMLISPSATPYAKMTPEMVATGTGLEQAMWRAGELEAIARQYHLALLIGEPYILGKEEIDETFKMFAGYGVQDG